MRETGEIVPSTVLELLKPMVTLAVGLLLSLTVNESVSPDSVVFNPVVGLTVIPAGIVIGVGVTRVGVGVGVTRVGVGVGVGGMGFGVLPGVSSSRIVYLAVAVVILGLGPGAIGFDRVMIMFSSVYGTKSPATSITMILDVSPGSNSILPLRPDVLKFPLKLS